MNRTLLKRASLLFGFVISIALPSSLTAQAMAAADGGSGGGQTSPHSDTGSYTLNHAEASVYADYFRFSPSGQASNFVGVGGRVGFNVQPNLALEGEINYDFARNYTTNVTTGNGTSTTTTFVTSSIRPITGLFGPKLQFGTSGPFRAFVTGKLGFLDFSVSNPNSVNSNQFANGISGVGGSGTHLAFYPGGGIEGFWGPVGLRLEAGDEIYLNNGAYNNLRVSVGPTIRF
ncbi:MAG TPA: hypothetical protein VL991_07250 [Terracidiphilus sp.]|nr:hypothetical protein [Terracidiphilus sp.]